MDRGGNRYQLAVAYRIYPGISKTPIVFPDDKLALSELCLDTFAQALGTLRARVYALTDGCPPEYEHLFRRHFASRDLEVIPVSRIGNAGTFARQIDILCRQTDAEYVYLAEDDYAYHPRALETMLRFMQGVSGVDFATPYDHPDYYELPLHAGASETVSFDGLQWRSAASTCLTFMTTRANLRRTAAAFGSYARRNRDASLWLSLTKRRVFDARQLFRFWRHDRATLKHYSRAWRHGWRQHLTGRAWKLWVPVPSLATHMESTGIAPGFDWEASLSERAGAMKAGAAGGRAGGPAPA